MPLLVNVHAHVGLLKGESFNPDNYNRESVINDLDRYAYYGVTAVLAFGSDAGDLAVHIRDEQKKGTQDGALLLTAGRGITAKGGWPTSSMKTIPVQISSELEARHAVDDNADNKVDAIAIWVDDEGGKTPKLKPELYKAVIDEAHKKNLHVIADVFSLADAKDLVKAGVDGFASSIRDREVDDDLISAMKAKNVFLAPALTELESKFVYADAPKWLGEQAMREVYPGQLSAFLSDPVIVNKIKRDPEIEKYRQQYAIAAKNVKKLSDGGVKIALGTGSGRPDTFPGYFEHRELELMVDAGISPMDAIKAGTATSASILGITDGGVLAVGKSADFFALSGNPLEKITNLKEITLVYKAGEELDRAKLIRSLPAPSVKITQADRAQEAVAEAKDAQEKAEAKLPHYGKFVLGETVKFRALAIPTPKGSKFEKKMGPPDHISVSMAAAKGGDLNEFYAQALPKYNWKAAGNCWEKADVITSKTASLCIAGSGGSVTIDITQK